MAVIHHTTLRPTKLELLTSWLPSRPWYGGDGAPPVLAKAGGFRLDDPDGEVGVEFMVVADSSGTSQATYLVPLTYRGAPLAGAGHALVGTLRHGVLGQRWVYDGCHDPVLVTQLLALVEGVCGAQDQNVDNTPAQDVDRSYTGTAPLAARPGVAAVDGRDGTDLPVAGGAVLRLHRVLREADGTPGRPQGAAGHVAGSWRRPDAARTRGLFAVLTTGVRGDGRV